MATLSNRMQVLIDDERLRRVSEEAAKAGVSVGEWIRSLIDERLAPNEQATKIKAFLEYVETIEPQFGPDLDAVAELRAARNARADRLIELDGA